MGTCLEMHLLLAWQNYETTVTNHYMLYLKQKKTYLFCLVNKFEACYTRGNAFKSHFHAFSPTYIITPNEAFPIWGEF